MPQATAILQQLRAGYAEHATGRGCRPSNERLAADTGLSGHAGFGVVANPPLRLAGFERRRVGRPWLRGRFLARRAAGELTHPRYRAGSTGTR